ncbi:zinc finger matrin-type protein 4 isoform X2 [Mesocricetus auratus]|uniref:Zinc finger matrin-type protein 4 isoform X2 n=1 Tax=Mesocricetus auratus TaxID=10036 RepID=A0ABM2WGX8_MESAU|nr:zinc finger matrin-type protein 4 isoform X2 [Mesocricetus auratus]
MKSSDIDQDLFTDSYCKVCSAQLISESQRVAHYESRKHASKVRLYYMLHPRDGGCPAKRLRAENGCNTRIRAASNSQLHTDVTHVCLALCFHTLLPGPSLCQPLWFPEGSTDSSSDFCIPSSLPDSWCFRISSLTPGKGWLLKAESRFLGFPRLLVHVPPTLLAALRGYVVPPHVAWKRTAYVLKSSIHFCLQF